MNLWLKRFQKKEDGLTLIELIVVVAIIGVLAWLITPRVLEALNTTKDRSLENLANEIMAGLERYAGDPDKGNGSYPTETQLTDALTGAATAASEFLEITISKYDSFVDTTATPHFDYESNGAQLFCAKIEGVTKDIWITNKGVYGTQAAAQTAVDPAASPAVTCP